MTIHASFHGFTKWRGTQLAVEDLTFDVPAGCVVGLIGPNGAGKSTALAGLTGLLDPTSGNAKVFGTDYRSLDRPARRIGTSPIDAVTWRPVAASRGELYETSAVGRFAVAS